MADIVSIDLDRCEGCNVCVQSCPVDVLRLDVSTAKAYVAYPQHCHRCYLCEDDCPTQAITVTAEASNSQRRSIYDVLGIDTSGPRPIRSKARKVR